jgi:pimeloyl-ACP methyl ester carboxylesterase
MMRWAGNRRRPDLAARLIFTAAFLSLTSWEGIGVKVWPRVPKLLGASFEAATPPATVRRKLDMLFSEDPGTPNGIPTEIVAGAWDLVAPLSGTRAVARKCDGARLAVMRWSGHAGAYSWPATYRRLVLEALERLSRPGLCYLRDR